MMKNPIDSVVSFFNPIAGVKRAQARHVQRNYDAAMQGGRNGGWFRPNTTGAQEVSKSADKLSSSAQELGRNNPLARRIKRLWANNTVGKGIQLDVIGKVDKKVEKCSKTFDDWFESTDCDFEGHLTGYGLQWLWVATLVESGAVFIRQHINPNSIFPLQLQTFEQSQLDKGKNRLTDEGSIIDGIQYSGMGQIEGYWFLVDATNTKLGRPAKSQFHAANTIIHIFDKERAGQHLGISFLHAAATTLKNYNTYQDAKLMQQQIAACFALIVEDSDRAIGLGGEGTRSLPDEIQPAMVEYVKSGSVPHVITPPNADNSSEFDVGLKRDISVGVGLSYEQVSGDYSRVNFASGRMAKMDFFIELDHMQMHIIKPALDKVFKWFITIYQIKNGKGDFKADWTFPPRAAVNPKEEFDVLMSKVRHGMKSPSKAAKELGERLEVIIAQWTKDKALFGELPFDIDPSVFAATGNQLDDNDAASANKQGVTGDTSDKVVK